MKIAHNYFLIVLFVFTNIFAQDRSQKNDTLDSQTVNVVKPYTPTISDAFKILDSPNYESDLNEAKKNVSYKTFSFPVISDFNPEKGSALPPSRNGWAKKVKNYVLAGIGNYTTFNLEGFVQSNPYKSKRFYSKFMHKSSQGGIEEVVLKDSYSNSDLELGFGQSFSKSELGVALDVNHKSLNWYGVKSEYIQDNNLQNQDVTQSYFDVGVNADLNFNKNSSVLDKSSIAFNTILDKFNTSELHIKLNNDFNVSLYDDNFKILSEIEVLSGSYLNELISLDEASYNAFNFQVNPYYVVSGDLVSARLGAKINTLSSSSKSKFFVYPDIKVSLNIVEGYLTSYLDVNGDMNLNTFSSYINLNPFLTPGVNVEHTHNPLDAKLGISGIISSVFNFDFFAGYKIEQDKFLFSSLTSPNTNLSYGFGNAFSVVYDNVNTINVTGALKANVTNEFTGYTEVSYSSFEVENGEAWNLPNLKLTLGGHYKYNEKWNFDLGTIFIGSRKDQFRDLNSSTTTTEDIQLQAVIDLNTKITYKYNSNWQFFLRGDNLLGENYELWTNTPYQGLQVLTGVVYEFGF